MKKLTYIALASLLVVPATTFGALTGIGGFVTDAGKIVQQATIVVAGIALLVFFWGLVKFISKAGDAKAVEDGRRLMIWGIVALFVMVSVWGIIYFIGAQIFGANNANPDYFLAPDVPTF